MPSGPHADGGIDQERQPLALHGPQCSSDHRQGDVPRDEVFGENAIDRLRLGRQLILAGEPEQGRSENVLGERAKDVPRCERVVNLRRAVRRETAPRPRPPTGWHRLPMRDRSRSASSAASGAGPRSPSQSSEEMTFAIESSVDTRSA